MPTAGDGAGAGAASSAYDTGMKPTIIPPPRRRRLGRGRPPRRRAAEILALEPDGVLLANGPGDPGAMDAHASEVRGLIDSGRPVFGICLGHQLVGRALGLKTFKLPFGHRGANHPVLERATGRVLVTSQNHGFAVREPASGTPPEIDVTHVSLYDNTVEGLSSAAGPCGACSSIPRRPRVRTTRGSSSNASSSLRARARARASGGIAMPRRDDLHTIAVIGSGPIVIGQACEFDYSGTQALQGAARGGLSQVVLVNSNPATIMTDPELADAHLRRAARPRGLTAVFGGSGPTRSFRRSAVRRP